MADAETLKILRERGTATQRAVMSLLQKQQAPGRSMTYSDELKQQAKARWDNGEDTPEIRAALSIPQKKEPRELNPNELKTQREEKEYGEMRPLMQAFEDPNVAQYQNPNGDIRSQGRLHPTRSQPVLGQPEQSSAADSTFTTPMPTPPDSMAHYGLDQYKVMTEQPPRQSLNQKIDQLVQDIRTGVPGAAEEAKSLLQIEANLKGGVTKPPKPYAPRPTDEAGQEFTERVVSGQKMMKPTVNIAGDVVPGLDPKSPEGIETAKFIETNQDSLVINQAARNWGFQDDLTAFTKAIPRVEAIEREYQRRLKLNDKFAKSKADAWLKSSTATKDYPEGVWSERKLDEFLRDIGRK